MRRTEERRDAGTRRWAEWYAATVFFVYCLLLLTHTAPPSLTDYANWTYQGVLLRGHLLGLPDAAHWLKLYPVPNSAATIAIGLLSVLLPWKIAANLWLCLQLLISFLAIRHLMRTTGGSAALWFIAPAALFLNVNFWYGFVNFELGVCWMILVASLLLRMDRLPNAGLMRECILGVLLLLAFFSHMIPFAFACLLLIFYAIQARHYRLLWQIAPATMLSIWYLFGRFILSGNADGQAGMVAQVRTFSGAFWAYKVNSYLKSFGFINPGSADGSVDITVFGRAVFVALFLVNALVCAILAWYMVRAAISAFRNRAPERFVWAAVALMLPLYALAPGTALGVSDPGSRVLQVMLAVSLLMISDRGLPLRVAAVCASILTAAGIFLFARLAFSPTVPVSSGRPLPHPVVIFGHVPYNDQDYFYTALQRNDMGLPVFPTGMFLNQVQKPSPRMQDGSSR